MNPHQKPQEDVVVTQEDREAAANWVGGDEARWLRGDDPDWVLSSPDHNPLVQAFARHRLLGHEAGRRDMREAAAVDWADPENRRKAHAYAEAHGLHILGPAEITAAINMPEAAAAERLAELWYHADGFTSLAEAGTLQEPPSWIAEALAAEHSGDCTKLPWSCLRCHAEEIMPVARWVAARWFSALPTEPLGGEGATTPA